MRNRKKGNYRCGRRPLNEKQYCAIDIMSEIGRCPNYEDIAKKIGVNRRTLYRWRLRKDFERELRKAIDIKMTAKYGGRHANILDAARNGDIAYLERLFDALALR